MQSRRHYQVKEVAELSGLSIRALHHYDAIGLLTSSFRTAAGYRVYDADDLLRLQQILIGRELGCPSRTFADRSTTRASIGAGHCWRSARRSSIARGTRPR